MVGATMFVLDRPSSSWKLGSQTGRKSVVPVEWEQSVRGVGDSHGSERDWAARRTRPLRSRLLILEDRHLQGFNKRLQLVVEDRRRLADVWRAQNLSLAR